MNARMEKVVAEAALVIAKADWDTAWCEDTHAEMARRLWEAGLLVGSDAAENAEVQR